MCMKQGGVICLTANNNVSVRKQANSECVSIRTCGASEDQND
jgi:hypothetical protein